MTVENPDPAVIAAKDQVHAEFTRLVSVRDTVPEGDARDAAQAAVADAYDKLRETDQSYFRLNIWGMGEARQLMLEDDALVDVDHPPFPAGDGPEAKEQVKRITDADPGYEAIPSYKLCSNDGWLVSPGECRAAARKMRRRLDPPAWYEQWTSYLEYAIDHGGFRVR